MKKIILSLAIVVLVVAGGFYFFGGNAGKSANSIVKATYEKMSDLESARYEGKLILEGKYVGEGVDKGKYFGGLGSLGLTMGEDVKKEEIKEGKVELSLSGIFLKDQDELDLENEIGLGLKWEETEGEVGEVSIDVKMLEKTSFLRLSALDLPASEGGDYESFLPFVQGLTGKWIKVEKGDMDNFKPTTDEEVEIETDKETKKKVEKIMKLAEKTEFFDMDKELGTEEIRGKKTIHLAGKLNTKETKKFILEAYEINHDGGEMPEEDVVKLDLFLEKVEDFAVELWVGKSDSYLYRVKIKGPYQDMQSGTDVYAILELEIYEHNKEVVIEEPTDYRTVEEMMGTLLFGGMFNNMMPSMPAEANMDFYPQMPSNLDASDLKGLDLESLQDQLEGLDLENLKLPENVQVEL